MVSSGSTTMVQIRSISSSTAKRVLVYFLVDIGVISDHVAAVYMVETGLKQNTVEELVEEMKESRER